MSSPIQAIDHLCIEVARLDDAMSDYAQLFDKSADWHGTIDEVPTAVFEATNVALVLQQVASPRGLSGLCFRVDDRDRLRRRARNLQLELHEDHHPDPLGLLLASDDVTPIDALATASARGLELSFVARPAARPFAASSAISGLDHAVVASSDGDGTALLLGARLGLDMRMDLSREDWNARLLFFRCGDLILEVFQRLDEDQPSDTDSFYGLSWRVPDADAGRERLHSLDFDVSDVRKGRKPGTRVFTARDRTGGVATLLLEPPESRSGQATP